MHKSFEFAENERNSGVCIRYYKKIGDEWNELTTIYLLINSI